MKKFASVLLVLSMALSLCACSLFSDDAVVQFGELYTHNDPDGLKYDTRKVMMNDAFDATLEETLNAEAYPDTLVYDEKGNIIGMYDYDPATGLASGYTDFNSGEFVEEEADLGMPDESLMVNFAGSVALGSVIYESEGKSVYHYLYAFLSDAADKDIVLDAMENYYGWSMEAESETVLVCKEDEATIGNRFQLWQQMYGQSQSDRSAEGYAANLKLDLGLRNYGVNPYAPTSAVEDPTDLEYDTKVVYTSNGAYSFTDESLEKDMKVRTDVFYGLEGKVVAHHIYYEFNSKEGADKLMNNANGNIFSEAQRLSDTVVRDNLTGQGLEVVINAYMSYGILSDDGLDGYIQNFEETYFLMRYDG